MTTPRPPLAVIDAVDIAATVYGVPAAAARDLGSDRDRTFAILRADERPIAVLKVSNRSEDPAVLDMEAEAALHIADPGLRVALPWRASRDAGPARPGDRPETLRASWRHGDAAHWVRLYDVLPGRSRIDARELSDEALEAWGVASARLTRALRGFSHPCARRPMPWDVRNALAARSMLDDVEDDEVRAAVAGVLDEFERRAVPIWPALRVQVVHADLTVENALSDDDGFVTGIIDFGDMGHTTVVSDLAAVLDSVAGGRDGTELLRAGGLVVRSFQRCVPLARLELQVLPIAWAARSALNIALASWRTARGLQERAFAERFNAPGLQTIRTLEGVGWDRAARALAEPVPRDS
jgi:Ser/Thr protein kinase RdoA (MazF antagonist)